MFVARQKDIDTEKASQVTILAKLTGGRPRDPCCWGPQNSPESSLTWGLVNCLSLETWETTWYFYSLSWWIGFLFPPSKRIFAKTLWSSCWRRQWHPTPVLLHGKSHGQRSLVGCSPWGCEELDMTEQLPFHFSLSCIGEGNGNPLQCSCLENPRNGRAWWAAVYRVAQSQTRLKRLSSSSSMVILYVMIKLGCVILFSLLSVLLKRNCWEGNGTPLQYSCLENPMDGGAW